MKEIPKSYKIGVSPITKDVYLGKLNKDESAWLSKKEINQLFFQCVVERFKGDLTELKKGGESEVLIGCFCYEKDKDIIDAINKAYEERKSK